MTVHFVCKGSSKSAKKVLMWAPLSPWVTLHHIFTCAHWATDCRCLVELIQASHSGLWPRCSFCVTFCSCSPFYLFYGSYSRKIRWADSPEKQGRLSQVPREPKMFYSVTGKPKVQNHADLEVCDTVPQAWYSKRCSQRKASKSGWEATIGGQATPGNWTSRTFLKLQTSLKKAKRNERQNIC